MNHASQHSEDGAQGAGTAGARRARERRVLWVGLIVSLLVHLVALGVIGGLLEQPPSPDPETPTTVVVPPRGMRAVELSGRAAPEAGMPDVAAPGLAQGDQEDASEPDTLPRLAEGRFEDGPADDLTAADRLAPRLVDPRLWRPVVLLPREPTLAEVQERVAAAVELLSDSALAETERAIRARDWTVEDDDGGRWGISPGVLHLGKLTLPLPIAFPVPITPEEIAREREWYDIQEQAQRAILLESFQERVKAIRERRDRERAERRGADPDSG